MGTLWTEVKALQEEISRTYRRNKKPEEDVPSETWSALPRQSFFSPVKFADLTERAIRDLWDVGHSDETWKDSIREPWRRLLIRLYVVGRVVAATQPAMWPGKTALPLHDDDICELRDVLIRAERSTSSARENAFSRSWVTLIDNPSSGN
jgi:hypothetical protein